MHINDIFFIEPGQYTSDRFAVHRLLRITTHAKLPESTWSSARGSVGINSTGNGHGHLQERNGELRKSRPNDDC